MTATELFSRALSTIACKLAWIRVCVFSNNDAIDYLLMITIGKGLHDFNTSKGRILFYSPVSSYGYRLSTIVKQRPLVGNVVGQ